MLTKTDPRVVKIQAVRTSVRRWCFDLYFLLRYVDGIGKSGLAQHSLD